VVDRLRHLVGLVESALDIPLLAADEGVLGLQDLVEQLREMGIKPAKDPVDEPGEQVCGSDWGGRAALVVAAVPPPAPAMGWRWAQKNRAPRLKQALSPGGGNVRRRPLPGAVRSHMKNIM
jgi:hypothetical protein